MSRILINSASKVAVLCEGNDEKYLISYLLDRNSLCFSKEQLLPDLRINVRTYYKNPDRFAQDYLGFSYENGIAVIVVKDTKKAFKLTPSYDNKVIGPYNCVTSPELEMLYVLAEKEFDNFQKEKGKSKPSIYMAKHFGITSKELKSKNFFEEYWGKNSHSIENVLKEYRKISPNKGKKDIYSVADLLKT
jgi:hypothetical protein